MFNEEMIDAKTAANSMRPRVKVSQVWRWMREGVVARNGTRIFLEHRRFGRKLFTTREALAHFGAQVADHDLQKWWKAPAVARQQAAPVKPEARTQAALAELAAAGV
jgi:hypothetical protein